MRLAGYKSAETYVGTARVAHVMAGYPLGDALKLFLRRAERAAVRGMGPSKRAATFDLIAAGAIWANSPCTQVVSSTGVPEFSRASLVIAVWWWLLRTAELVELRLRCVRLHTAPKRAELRLGTACRSGQRAV